MILVLAVVSACGPASPETSVDAPTVTPDGPPAPEFTGRLRVAHYNVMEMSTDKLLASASSQAGAFTQIIALEHPDIVELEEIEFDITGYPTTGTPGAPRTTMPGTFVLDRGDDHPAAQNARRIADRVAAIDPAVTFADAFQTTGNSGFRWTGSTNGNDSFYLRGWGEYPGRFNTVVLSKYPIVADQVRVIHDYPWKQLPGNLIAQLQTDLNTTVPDGFPLFEKSLNIIPVDLGAGGILYLVCHHPTSPPAIFDPIDPYRNRDELVALDLFVKGQLPGVDPLPAGARFLVIGDLNGDPFDGSNMAPGITNLLASSALVPRFPEGPGTRGTHPERKTWLSGCGKNDGTTVADPTTKSQLQLDYMLPSTTIGAAVDMGMFWPDFRTDRAGFDLSCHGSDHHLIYGDFDIPTN